MTTLDTLRTLAEAANRALADEYSLHGFDNPPRITPGMVRCVQAALDEAAAAPHAAPSLLASDNGVLRLAERIDQTLLRHHILHLDLEEQGVAFAPLSADHPDTPALEAAAAQVRAEKAVQHPMGRRYGLPPAEFRALVLSEIRRIAGPDGTWVSLADFDAARTTQLPTAGGVTKRLGCRWTDVVVEALGERATPPDRVQRMNQAKQQEAQTKPEPPSTFRQKLDATVPSAPEALAEPPAALAAPSAHLPWSPEKRRTVLRDILAELAMMADDGIMPSQSDWDARKPAALPTASTICVQWEISWAELAGYAKLSIAHKGRPPKQAATIIRTGARNGLVRPVSEAV